MVKNSIELLEVWYLDVEICGGNRYVIQAVQSMVLLPLYMLMPLATFKDHLLRDASIFPTVWRLCCKDKSTFFLCFRLLLLVLLSTSLPVPLEEVMLCQLV